MNLQQNLEIGRALNMEKMEFQFDTTGKRSQGNRTVCGVVGSGNLEVIVEENKTLHTIFNVQTAVEHYRPIWKMVIDDFVSDHKPVGLHFTLNDNGATPAVVSLRPLRASDSETKLR